MYGIKRLYEKNGVLPVKKVGTALQKEPLSKDAYKQKGIEMPETKEKVYRAFGQHIGSQRLLKPRSQRN
jgi:hypothetical protein